MSERQEIEAFVAQALESYFANRVGVSVVRMEYGDTVVITNTGTLLNVSTRGYPIPRMAST